ncbi:MAG: hypothetical protein OEZ34_16700 [Spirochaetia bacterium]|nr:hypothetical protein [Spirochaetia bacterium]
MKASVGNDYAAVGTRTVFNKTLRHLVNVSSLIEFIGGGGNLADQLIGLESQGAIIKQQIPPIISVVLAEKFEYAYKSANMTETISDFSKIQSTVSRWTGVDYVGAYYHPNFGVILFNPKVSEHWANVQDLKKDELVVIYAKTVNNNKDSSEKAVDAFFQLIAGQSPAEDPSFLEAKKAAPPPPPPKPAPAAAPQQAAAPRPGGAPAPAKPKGPKNLTPKYSVQVSNELFHNGNVEAWKNIIESYEAKHPDCKVIVYHEGELIQDLNSLFKWGKVKHQGLIFFQIAGSEIKNVSRLQKYLYEGASKRYEAFMKKDINKILNLF